MKQLPDYGDKRQAMMCAHCGAATGTRDHVPSKSLLDEPYPENLPVVPACVVCNTGFALDEEYVACAIDYALCGGGRCPPPRAKVRRILEAKPALAARLEQAYQIASAEGVLSVETDRVRRVILKLARGHALYELHEPQIGAPSFCGFAPLATCSSEQRDAFEAPAASPSIWPEVGSRAIQRLLVVHSRASREVMAPGWIDVQPERYRYLAFVGSAVTVRMVLSEYLACEVVWSA